MEKLQEFSNTDVHKQCQAITDTLSLQEKGPPSQKRIHVINYMGTIARVPNVANHLVQCSCINVLAKQARDAQTIEL